MIGGEVPSYHAGRRTYHADTCAPMAEAARGGEIHMEALARGTYPGRRLRSGDLEGLRSVGFWDAARPQSWGLPWHRNEGIEITLQETGGTAFRVGRARRNLEPGDMAITRPWQAHCLGDPAVGPGRLYWLILDVGVRQPHQAWHWPDWLVMAGPDLRELTRYLRQNEEPVRKASVEMRRCFSKLGDTVSGAGGESTVSRAAIYVNELLLLLLESLRESRLRLSPSLSHASRSTKMFLERLAEDPAEPWTLETMAAHCGLGVTRFTHYCREITNQTPMQYLNHLRIERARNLLRAAPDRSITEIAMACGFSTSQYFATVFRRCVGVSPKSFRARG
ncbi:AraC family transcriptional regulator [Kiritimatiella glycovorans]|nr:AraC family transcriptional regulator [Kiritimatiella glycovorans]